MGEQKKASNKTAWIIGCLILIFLAITVFNFLGLRKKDDSLAPKEEKVPVQVDTVKKGELDWFLDVTGDLKPFQVVDVHPKVAGRIIEKILVEKGDWVKKGQLLAVLEKDTVKARVNRARAEVEVAQTNLEVLQKDYRRIKNLFREHAAPKQKLDHIQAELKAAKARLKQAGAVLKELQILYRNHNIYAPCKGVVTARYVDPGNLSDTEIPVLRISNEKILKVETSIPERDFPFVRKGMEVTFHTDAYPEKAFSGQIAIVSPTLNPKSRTANIEIHIPNNDLTLRSGMFAHVRLYFGKKKALIISRDALNKVPGTGNYYVYVIKGQKAYLRNIQTGLKQGNRVQVISGLHEGEQIVVKGQNRLKDGVLVEVKEKRDETN
ncbi:efflux RND transporter periplasmic adaptor subunit [Desulfohalobiaceae bacterium Ax17]|uniref:efflux RND transporter periplasmic adaptor subunit n=1 Tax=Desulfovulcanus ferrireducens TaxID=2831190 RepID=UPI00207BAB58|nr:efflux RND transporter periplasmic adaptor subunit [Desulfovulcanus ferrireducens]MBT8762720.1 efflux RND transporter periplasmic adaptor subunit [Desulfovulcanus ferrireducens]